MKTYISHLFCDVFNVLNNMLSMETVKPLKQRDKINIILFEFTERTLTKIYYFQFQRAKTPKIDNP